MAGFGSVTFPPFARASRGAIVAPVAFVGLFALWPTISALRRGLDATAVLSNGALRDTVVFTAWQAALSTVVTVVVGLPATWVLSRHEFSGRRLVRALTLVPFVLPTLVVGLAFRAVLPGNLRTGTTALIAAHVFLNVAVVVRIVGARWESQPDTFDHAAATLGAGPLRRFVSVTWPMIRGSVAAAAGLVFMYCFSTYGAARVLAGPSNPVVETEIYRFAVLAGDMKAASALAMAQIVLVATVLAITARGASYRSLPGRPAALRNLSRSHRVAVASGAAFIVVVFSLPLIGLTLRSFNVGNRFTLSAWHAAFDDLPTSANLPAALLASLSTAAAATIIALAIGTLIAFSTVHSGSRLTRGISVSCEAFPVVVSAVVIGLGFILAFRSGAFDWRGEWWLLPVAHALVALPLVSRSLAASMRQIPDDLRHAAATLGSSPLRVLVDIDASILRRPLASAATLAALVSLGEFGASSLLSRSGNETLTMTIGRMLGRPGDLIQAQAFVAATVLGIVCLALVTVVDLAPERR